MGKRIRQIKYYGYIGMTFVGAAIMLFLITREACGTLPKAEEQLRVYDNRDMTASIEAAMGIMNKAAGCELLIPGTPDDYDIQFIGMVDTPCRVGSFHEGIESGHTASAYRCPTSGKWDIDVEQPGDIHTMVCIAAHELGHVLGLSDHKGKGVMNQYACPEHIWPSDAERAYLEKTYCASK